MQTAQIKYAQNYMHKMQILLRQPVKGDFDFTFTFTFWFCIGRLGTSSGRTTSESELHRDFYRVRLPFSFKWQTFSKYNEIGIPKLQTGWAAGQCSRTWRDRHSDT